MTSDGRDSNHDLWPSLESDAIAPTAGYLHRIAQIAGKYALFQPFTANFINVMLVPNARGFASSTTWVGDVAFETRFDLLDGIAQLVANTGTVAIPLALGSVAAFYAAFRAAAASLGIPALRTECETEIADAKAFAADTERRPYDAGAARAIWAAYASAARALERWQANYTGPHARPGIMWGGFDLYAPRYCGKFLTPPSDKPAFMRNGMCEEEVVVGFFLGDRTTPAGMYAYVVPAPDGMASADFGVRGAMWIAQAGLVTLPWATLRMTADPEATIVTFADAIYAIAVTKAGWAPMRADRPDGWHAGRNFVSPQ